MKTNHIMKRDDVWRQRTKDKYFHANLLLKSFNKVNNSKKDLSEYKRLKSTADFVLQLKKEGIARPFIASKQGTWMHPKLFIDFAMWVSIEFKSQVIDYVLDGLIDSRHDAGDYYKEMCAAIIEAYYLHYGCKPNPKIYKDEANMIAVILNVKGKSRNEMTEKELNCITFLQKKNALMIKNKVGKNSRKRNLEIDAQAFLK